MVGKFQRQEFVKLQAEAYRDYASKEGAGDFDFWADSKGFMFLDKQTILKITRRASSKYFDNI